MQTSKPSRDQVVPPHGHGKTGDSSKYVIGRPEQTQLEQKNSSNRKQAAKSGAAQRNANCLRDGGDEVDVAALAKGNHRAGAENEHGADDRRGDPYRLSDAPLSLPAFTRQDRDIFQTAKRTKKHLTEERERAQVVGRKFQGKRCPMNGRVTRKCPEWQKNEPEKNNQDGDPADVVNPLANLKSANGGDGDNCDNQDDDRKRCETILGKPDGGGANEVRKLGGNGVKDGSSYHNAVHPEVPRGKESTKVTVCLVRPDVETALQRPCAVETDNRGRHRDVEEQHGGHPGQSLSPAESGGDSDPGATNNA